MMRNLEITKDLQYYNDSFGFDENFVVLQHDGYRTMSITLYVEYGNLNNEYDVEEDCIIADTRENRVKIQRHLTKCGYIRVSDVFGTLEELRDEFDGVNYNNIGELYTLLEELGIEWESNYLRMETRGYSQGDYGVILINRYEFEIKMGTPFRPEEMQKWFDHYYWDQPISGNIGVEFEYTASCGVTDYIDIELDFIEYTDDEYDVDGLDVGAMMTAILYECAYQMHDDEIAELRNQLELISYSDVKYPCSC